MEQVKYHYNTIGVVLRVLAFVVLIVPIFLTFTAQGYLFIWEKVDNWLNIILPPMYERYPR